MLYKRQSQTVNMEHVLTMTVIKASPQVPHIEGKPYMLEFWFGGDDVIYWAYETHEQATEAMEEIFDEHKGRTVNG